MSVPAIALAKSIAMSRLVDAHILDSNVWCLTRVSSIVQNNPLLYEEFKNQKNGFFMKPAPDFKIGRQLFKEKLRTNFRMSRCFDKENRMRLAIKCVTKAELKTDLGEFIKNPVVELLKRKYVSRNFNTIHHVIEKISKLPSSSSVAVSAAATNNNKEILISESAVNLKNNPR